MEIYSFANIIAHKATSNYYDGRRPTGNYSYADRTFPLHSHHPAAEPDIRGKYYEFWSLFRPFSFFFRGVCPFSLPRQRWFIYKINLSAVGRRARRPHLNCKSVYFKPFNQQKGKKKKKKIRRVCNSFYKNPIIEMYVWTVSQRIKRVLHFIRTEQ